MGRYEKNLLGIIMNFNENIKMKEKMRKYQGGVLTKLRVSPLLIALEKHTWYHIKTLSRLSFCTRLRRLRLIPIEMSNFVGAPQFIFLCFFSFLSNVLLTLMIYKLQNSYTRPLGKKFFFPALNW